MASSIVQLAFLKTMLWALKTESNELKPLNNVSTTLFYASQGLILRAGWVFSRNIQNLFVQFLIHVE